MEPLRTWTIEGETPLTVSIYQPAVMLRCGDGPEVAISPSQVSKLAGRFIEAEDFFATEDPEVL